MVDRNIGRSTTSWTERIRGDNIPTRSVTGSCKEERGQENQIALSERGIWKVTETPDGRKGKEGGLRLMSNQRWKTGRALMRCTGTS